MIGESSKGLSSSSNHNKFKTKNQPFNYKPQSSIAESIKEELTSSFDKRSRRSPDKESSIAEESHL